MDKEKETRAGSTASSEKKTDTASDGLIIDIFKKMLEYNFQEMGKKKSF
ncbi:hypothetical protein DGMP_25600 [Desulfomarina profundi]|uniref:Uncharacterized protein n=1 Tax=Desulfomarina profundi TaxID=2772557 RepID=A0A8D5JMR0_9BACT|nr:hypothetical protein [Desulfomarina profundi]BCL61867.1 hypothetical protein DGMP_25600 [Desulfomarina profundi]